ncbi:MAG: YhgE/Pip domain-containing protein, partial [Lysinibacillus sp.]
MIKAEWLQILKTRKMLVSIVAVLFIPVMYAGMFLWAFWDPYVGLPDLPVAIVNDDKGAEMEGVELKLGDDLIEKLIDSEQFKFIEVSKDEAEKGLNGRDYYMILEIPENFSAHATTLLDEKPSKLVMNYIPNEGINFLGAQIGETAMELIRSEVNVQVSATYAEKLFDTITTLGDGFTEAADGSSKLDEGAKKLASGAGDLQGYLKQLASSTIELSNGSNQLTQGAQTASVGANELATGLLKLQDGATQLQQGAKQTSVGAASLHDGITQYTKGVTQVESGLLTLNEQQQRMIAGTASIANNAAKLNGSASQAKTDTANLQANISSLSSQLQNVITAMPPSEAAALKQTIAQLEAGSATVHNGLNSLVTGSADIQAGANGLNGDASKIKTA